MTIDPQLPPEIRRPRPLAAALLALCVIALAGCGSSSSSSSSTPTAKEPSTSTATSGSGSASTPAAGTAAGGGRSLSLEANREGQLEYNTRTLRAKAGRVSIAFANSSPLEHNVTIESSSGSIVGATPTFRGSTRMLSVDLKPGTYKFFCSVPGHRMAGMEGTITVR